jgi:hypothetical protein
MRKSHIAGLVLLALVMAFIPARSSAQISVGVAVHIGPPALPVYEQPIFTRLTGLLRLHRTAEARGQILRRIRIA